MAEAKKIETFCLASSGDVDECDVSVSSEANCFSTKDFLQPKLLVLSTNRENNHLFPSSFIGTNDCPNDSSDSTDNFQSHIDAIYTFSGHNFAIRVNEIIAKHGTSDVEAADRLKLMKTAFSENNMPSFLSLKRDESRNVVSILKTTTCGEDELSLWILYRNNWINLKLIHPNLLSAPHLVFLLKM